VSRGRGTPVANSPDYANRAIGTAAGLPRNSSVSAHTSAS
jgi:hypothetical protein